VTIVLGVVLILAVAVLYRIIDADRQKVSQAAFLRVRPGMTYAEVCSIIGFPGVEVSRASLPAQPTPRVFSNANDAYAHIAQATMRGDSSGEMIDYAWVNPDGSNMKASFQGDRLIVKAQFGLK
jgi:hypothetical protein